MPDLVVLARLPLLTLAFRTQPTGSCLVIAQESDNPPKFTVDPKDPALLEFIKKSYLDPKIIGEDDNKQLLFLVCCSAFTSNPLSAIVKGPSAAGKSHLVNRVLDIFRELGVVIEFSRITGAYLENMAKSKSSIPKPVMRREVTREEFDVQLKAWREQPRQMDLSRKIIFIDELRGIQNVQAPKLLISEGRLRLGTVINGQPVEIEVTGTPVIITTTTLAVLQDPEFENRVIPIQIDETENQTRQILEHEAGRFADPAEDMTEQSRTKAIVDFLSQQQDLKLANPFGASIQQDYPTKNIEARRDFPKLLALSNVIAWLYQKQRRLAKKGLDIVIVTDLQDIEKVKQLALGPLRESLAGLSEKEEKLLEVAKQTFVSADSLDPKIGNYEPLTIKDYMTLTRKTVRHSEQWVRDHVNRMAEEGYLEPVEQNKKPFTWRYASLQPESLEIKTEKYSSEIVTTWAEAYGYKLLELGLATSQSIAQSSPLPAFEPKNSPNFDLGEPPLPNQHFGDGQELNEDVAKPNPNAVHPSDNVSDTSENPKRSSDTPPEGWGDTGGAQEGQIPSQDQGMERLRPVLDASGLEPSDTNFKPPQTDSTPSDVAADELRLVRQAFRTEMDRFGQCNVAKIRYLVKDEIPDPNRVTRIVTVMAKNGELEPWGHDCFRLKASREVG